MKDHPHVRAAARLAATAAGAATTAYGIYVASEWLRYGRPATAREGDLDPLLDRFMPQHEITERHHIDIAAPAEVTFDAACEMDMMAVPAIRAIFKGRELLLKSEPDRAVRPREFIALVKSIGWGVLAEVPRRAIVMGAVTKPWEANVVFQPLPPDEFAAFATPGYVKIAWTIRADAVDASHSVFRTETRAVATDPIAREKFRRYWAFLSPGIIAIRWMTLGPVKREAEQRWRLRMSRPDGPETESLNRT